ncbi:UNVERIFIED_CONTAM: hypothetical protein FKN15_032947, partial [Acipenser sinensis]
SFLEIYNERVRDLLQRPDKKKPFTLRVREHPEKGPYVQGNTTITIHDVAILENNLPSEIISKINLVDLAGSERADPNYCRDRITEGANINKSLVTLGIVISTLAISPSSSSYSDTLSTLRYASHARSIVNKPQVNEDASVKLIRELREEIDRLKTMLMSFELVEQLTKDWSDKWKEKQELMEEYRVDINREKAGVLIDSHLPHLIAVDGDVLSTGIVFYHLRVPAWAVIVLGRTHTFRFNHPAEAAVLRQRRRVTPLLPPGCPVPGREV